MSKTVVDVDGHELTFITTMWETVAISTEPLYDKRVARHKRDGRTKAQKHKSVENLFYLYIEDYKRCLHSSRNNTV